MNAGLSDKRVLVTSGPTRAPLDAVRFISNRSSGRLGCAIARELLSRGAYVTLIAGAGSVAPAPDELAEGERGRLDLMRIETVQELMDALKETLEGEAPPDAVVHAMAVLDYLPESFDARKRPSGQGLWKLRLLPGPKVIEHIRRWAPQVCLVQFKLEVGVSEEDLVGRAQESLQRNSADLVVANDLERISDWQHPALILGPDGTVLGRPHTREEIAAALCDALEEKI